jgi:hypothetical protein
MKQEIKESFGNFSLYDAIIVHFLKFLTKLQLQIKLNELNFLFEYFSHSFESFSTTCHDCPNFQMI